MRSQFKECGGGGICQHGRQRSKCKEEAWSSCQSRLAACRERAASCLHVRPPSLQHRACERQRDMDDDSDDDEGMQIAMSRSHADQCGVRQQAQTGASRLVATSSESDAGPSLSEVGPGPLSEAALSLEAGPPSPSQPGVEAKQTCSNLHVSAWTAAMVSHVVGLILRSTCEAGATRHAVDPHSTLSACPLGCLTRIQWRPHMGPCLYHPIARIAVAIGWLQPRVVCCRA